MRKEIDEIINKNSFSKESYDISLIEQKIDEILLKNKDKVNGNMVSASDIEKISLKSRDGKKIYYLKKKKCEKGEIFSEKIIDEAKTNLGKRLKNNKETKEKKKKIKETSSGGKSTTKKYESISRDIDKAINLDSNEPIDELIEIVSSKKPKHKYEEKEPTGGKEKFETNIVEKTVNDTKAKHHEAPLKYKFKVENLPDKQDVKEEIEFIDKRLKEGIKTELNDDEKDETEKIAQDLIKKHMEEGHILTDQKTFDKEKIFLKNKDAKFDFSSMGGENESEHVFFDEHDSFDGWSPHITESDRRKMLSPLSIKSEVDFESKRLIKDIELPKEVLNIKSVNLSDLGFSENEWEELDFYSLYEPFAYVEILREKDTLDKCYFLVEVDITKEEEEKLEFLKDTMKKFAFDTEEMEYEGEDEYLLNSIEKIIKEYNINLEEISKHKILYYLRKSSLGLGRIDPLMRDPNIEDISCDGAGVPLFVYHRKYGSLRSNIKFDNEDELSSFIHRLAQKCGKHISIAEPMLDATMPDGSRIQMTLSDEITAKGSTFTIRKFKDDPFSPPDLYEYNTMSSEMLAYLWIAVENGINTLFAGGTASGKTTALNAISLFIPAEAKIVSIEETREINLPHTNWIPGVARTGFGGVVVDDKVQGEIDMYDLMKAALRQRPEYILVGEIRGKEAYVLFQAMATGHATYSTVHADSAKALIHRLEGKPIEIPRIMIQSLDVVSIHVTTRVNGKRVRRCKQIVEIIDIDPTTKEILTNEVFRWDPIKDEFIYTGKSYVLEGIRARWDLSKEQITKEIRTRTQVLEWMAQNNIRTFKEVAKVISRYAENPDNFLKEIKNFNSKKNNNKNKDNDSLKKNLEKTK